MDIAAQDPSMKNLAKLDSYCSFKAGTFEERMTMVENGLIDCCATILRTHEQLDPKASDKVWGWLHKFVHIKDFEDSREMGADSPSKICHRKGFFELCARELHNHFNSSDEAVGFVVWCAADLETIPWLVAAGCHVDAIEHIKLQDDFADRCLGVIRMLCTPATGPVRATLRSCGALEASLPFVSKIEAALESGKDLQIRAVFRAISVVCRLGGSDEEGAVPEVLSGNPAVIGLMIDVLKKATETKKKILVFRMGIAPEHASMDLLVVAASDKNKPLLAPVIPILYDALQRFGATNAALIADTINIFLLLSFEAQCKQELLRVGVDKISELSNMITNESELQRCHANLMDNLVESKNAVRPGAGASKKWVMLSYNWGVKSTVLLVNTLLKSRGIATWVDEHDMGSNIADSMAGAVENASAVVCFLTQAYKMSGNCRRECEYADSLGVPIVFVMAEEFKPSGWLALVMGRALYISMFSEAQVAQHIDVLAIRLTEKSSDAPSQADEIIVASAGSGMDVIAAMKSLQDELATLKLRVDTIESSQIEKDKEIAMLRALVKSASKKKRFGFFS